MLNVTMMQKDKEVEDQETGQDKGRSVVKAI